MTATATVGRRRLPASDLARLSTVGLRTRKLRAGLSALGIAIGVAAIVAVLGLSASSQAGLLAEINRLGTNLLTVSERAERHRRHRRAADHGAGHDRPDQRCAAGAEHRGQSRGVGAFRNPFIPSVDTNGLTVEAASLDLLPVLATTLAQGHYLNAATAQEPVAVLGATSRPAARHRPRLSRPSASGWAASGSTSPASSDRPCSLLTSTPPSWSATPRQRGTWASTATPPPSTSAPQDDRVNAVDNLLAATANPENPSGVNVSQPSDALVAQADAKSALNGLFLGLGAVALLVGAVGVANIMIISVLERRSEIGLRRALGATRGHIRTQFLSEADPARTARRSRRRRPRRRGHRRLRPHQTLGHHHPHRSLGRRHRRLPRSSARVAGLIPALRAARLSPTQALWSV